MIMSTWLDFGTDYVKFLDQDQFETFLSKYLIWWLSIEILSNFCPKEPQQEEFGQKSSVLLDFYEGASGS